MGGKTFGVRIRSAAALLTLALAATACPAEPPPIQPEQQPIVPPAPFTGPGTYNQDLLNETDVVAFHGSATDEIIPPFFGGVTFLEKDDITTFGWQDTYNAVATQTVPNELISDQFGATDPTSDRRFRHTPVAGTVYTLHELIEGPDGAENVLWSYRTQPLGGNEGGGPAWYYPLKQFSPDGRFVISVGYPPNWFAVSDADTGDIIFSESGDIYSPLSPPNWSEDGNHLFYASYVSTEHADGTSSLDATIHAVDFTTGEPIERIVTPPDLSNVAPLLADFQCAIKDWSATDRLAWACTPFTTSPVTYGLTLAVVTSDLNGGNLHAYYEDFTATGEYAPYGGPAFLDDGRIMMLRRPAPSENAPMQTILFDDTNRTVIGSLAVGAAPPSTAILGIAPFAHVYLGY